MAEFTGTAFVQNEIFGSLPTDQYKLEQVDENFGIENLYTIRFTPVNPIPMAGIVLIQYPSTIGIDVPKFEERCGALTSLSFIGPQYCMLDDANRKIWFFDIFRDQEVYTSEIAVDFYFTNPISNFNDHLSAEDRSFHIKTYDIDLTEFPDLVTTQYSDQAVKAFVDTVKLDPEKYVYGIDKTVENNLEAKLKCNAPCYHCKDSDPDWCLSCWGPGADGTFPSVYLQ